MMVNKETAKISKHDKITHSEETMANKNDDKKRTLNHAKAKKCNLQKFRSFTRLLGNCAVLDNEMSHPDFVTLNKKALNDITRFVGAESSIDLSEFLPQYKAYIKDILSYYRANEPDSSEKNDIHMNSYGNEPYPAKNMDALKLNTQFNFNRPIKKTNENLIKKYSKSYLALFFAAAA